jgi:uncharacterized protein (TIGR03067 family)
MTTPPELDGEWAPIAADVSGHALDVATLRVARLLIEHSTYDIIDRDAQRVDRGTLEPAGAPAALDLVGTDGPAAGRRFRTITELDGDRLCICYDLESDERPASMQPEGDQLLLCITYARVRRRE